MEPVTEMLSRVADSLYWMSRYFERADNIARAIDATHSLMLSRVEAAAGERWYHALTAMGLQLEAANPDPQNALRRLAADPTLRTSMISCLAAARENASQVREEISSEMWEQLNRLYHQAVALSAEVADDESVVRLVTAVREGSYAFAGVSETTMTHGVEVGMARAQSRDLQAATDQLIDSFVSGNNGMRVANQQRSSISGRNAIMTSLEGNSAVGGIEYVDVVTALMANGDLFYYVTVVPERDRRNYYDAFRRVQSSIRLTAG